MKSKPRKLTVLPDFPSMQCDDECGQCCSGGAVPVSEGEYQRVRRFVREHGITPRFEEHEPFRCPFYQEGQCAIYEGRPLICRAFGHVDHPELTCPRGYNVNVSSEEGKRVGEVIANQGTATRVLHELALEAKPELATKISLEELWAFAPESHRKKIPKRKGVQSTIG